MKAIHWCQLHWDAFPWFLCVCFYILTKLPNSSWLCLIDCSHSGSPRLETRSCNPFLWQMWANMMPARCASLGKPRNNPPACGLAALQQWGKYCDIQWQRDTWNQNTPEWSTLRVKLWFLHFILYAENLGHIFLLQAYLPAAEVKGLQKSGQIEFGKGRPQRGSAKDITALCSSEDRSRGRPKQSG